MFHDSDVREHVPFRSPTNLILASTRDIYSCYVCYKNAAPSARLQNMFRQGGCPQLYFWFTWGIRTLDDFFSSHKFWSCISFATNLIGRGLVEIMEIRQEINLFGDATNKLTI